MVCTAGEKKKKDREKTSKQTQEKESDTERERERERKKLENGSGCGIQRYLRTHVEAQDDTRGDDGRGACRRDVKREREKKGESDWAHTESSGGTVVKEKKKKKKNKKARYAQ